MKAVVQIFNVLVVLPIVGMMLYLINHFDQVLTYLGYWFCVMMIYCFILDPLKTAIQKRHQMTNYSKM